MVTPTAICLAHYAKLDLEKMSAQILRIFPAPFLVHMKKSTPGEVEYTYHTVFISIINML